MPPTRSQPLLPVASTLALLPSLVLPACGKDGSSSRGASSVALLVTDASVGDFTSLRMTVNAIDLFSPGLGRQNVWTGSAEVDLIQLAEYAELFAVADSMPAGTCDQIQVDKAPLARVPNRGFSLNTDHVNLNPQGGSR